MTKLTYYIRRHKILRRTCKLALNLTVLSVLGFLIYFGVRLFTKELSLHPAIGSLIFLTVLAVFIWLCRITLQNHWRPSMRITVVSLICLSLVFAFAGVKPIAEYKDIIIDRITTYYEHRAISEGGDIIDPPDHVTTVTYEDLFNQFRQENGLGSLIFTADLDRVARLRAEEIRMDFSHDSSGGYNLHLGENIAMSTGWLSDAEALNLWKESSGHRTNMLDVDYEYTGYANNEGYVVQVFSMFVTIDGVPQLPPGWYWDE